LRALRRSAFVLTAIALAAASASCRGCRRELTVPDATYRETVAAFHTALAAMQTSQEVLARREFERVTTLVPGEPAGWANLGLLLMRQQDMEGAGAKLAEAQKLAPRSAAIQRLLGLFESRQGRLDESIRHLRRAVDLDQTDLRAPYALALELERQGGPSGLKDAQAALDALLGRSENLAARLELARLCAKAGDGAALQKAIAPLRAAAPGWPEPAQEQWRALEASLSDPAAAATRVSFLKNVLLREAAYRRALAAVSTPRAEIGEPVPRFLALRNPEAQPAAPDGALAFRVEAFGAPGAGTAIAAWLTGEGAPVVLSADGRELRLPAQSVPVFPAGGSGAPAIVAADFNYDHRVDLLLAGPAGLRLLRQAEGGGFTDVSGATSLPAALLSAPAFDAWAADVDTDGDLDAVVGPVTGSALVLRNNGDGTFAEQRPFGGVANPRGFAWADLDGDGVPDAALLDGAGAVRVFLNLRGGAFREERVPALNAVAIGAEAVGPGFSVIAVAADGAIARLALVEGRWTSRPLARLPVEAPGPAPGAARLVTADLDNNGAADLLVSHGSQTRVLLGKAGEAFDPLPAPLALVAHDAADLDADGRLEVIGVAGDGRAAKAVVTGSKAYGWQVIRPKSAAATGDQRINSFGIGGEVELRTGLHLQRRAIDAPVVHFGLGEAQQAEVVRILWPNGILQSEFNTKSGATVDATQRLKGSCPWLFAWNGREMAFVTDLIWRSPLGLRINAQTTADVLMTEDWVKVRGDQLAAKDGAYDLRVTAELWETHFFDLLSMLVVDHPEGTEVFVDERFAVPPPALRVIVTGPVQDLSGARDDTGADAMGALRSRDDRHLDFAGRGAYQGVTRDHHVELELPDSAPRTGPLYLVAQGWVHPTDSSINVAMGQGRHAPPQGLSLHVADASGRFRKVREGLGFPSGKDKTVLLDLSGVLPAKGPVRIRLATNLEIFWDRIGWAAGRPDVLVKPQRIDASSAELDDRGYSVTRQPNPSSPERPSYVLEGTTPRWLDLEGYHTRFGDVRELLVRVDDRYVIMNAGDEIRLRFPAAPPAAPGQVRDFVLMGDGWVKDGDFNTTFSRTVLPLPTHATGRYDTPPRALEDDPVYRQQARDYAEYHTRYVSPERARFALEPRR
jgi:tetratricopeptide (TPR) repeat protein